MEQETAKKTRKRIGSVDIVKGITIFLVVMGHVAGNLDKPFYRLVLYAFHMPLFFMVSGMVLKPAKEFNLGHWKNFLSKNILALMVPYFIWGAIYSQFSYVNLGWILYGSWEALGKAGTLTSLWFLPCLFMARVMMEGIFHLTHKLQVNKRLLAGILSLVAFGIGMILPKVEIGYFWCLNVAFVALGFLLLGFAVQDLLKKFYTSVSPYMYWIATIVCGAMFVAGTFLRKESLELVIMCGAQYGNLFYFFWNALTGSAAVFFFSMILSNSGKQSAFFGYIKKKVSYAGSITFGILVLHKPFLQEVVMGVLSRFGLNANQVVTAFFASVIAVVFCCIMINIMNRFVPQLLGKFPDFERAKSEDSDGK